MSCGLEHLANCHGEWSLVATLATGGLLWWRLSWNKLKEKCCLHLNKKTDHDKDCHDHNDCPK